jgi:hypothetical protein
MKQSLIDALDQLTDWVAVRFPFETRVLAASIVREGREALSRISIYDFEKWNAVYLDTTRRAWELALGNVLEQCLDESSDSLGMGE